MYIERTVAFLDILGFEDIIERTENDLALLVQVGKALHSILELDNSSDIPQRQGAVIPMYIQCFSDSVVICGEALWVLDQVAALSQSLIRLGVIVRGGITFGKIYCGYRTVFGPALNRAVQIEKVISVVPRVLIDLPVLERLKFENSPAAAGLIAQDTDGMYFVHFLHPFQSSERGKDTIMYSEFIAQLRNVTINGLSRFANDDKRLVKYQWLCRYFNLIVKDHDIRWIQPITESR